MTKIQILLFDGLDELDAVGPYEVLRAAGLGVRLVTLTGAEGTITGGHGLVFQVDGALDGSTEGVLVVPGGGWVSGPDGGARRAASNPALLDAIRVAHEAGTVIASVCTGGLILGATGLLKGRPAVTHHVALDVLGEQGADVRAGERVVDDGDLVSCGGVTSGLDLALHLVERFVGARAAEQGAIRIEHDRRPALVTASRLPAES